MNSCSTCGALIGDVETHSAFHEAILDMVTATAALVNMPSLNIEEFNVELSKIDGFVDDVKAMHRDIISLTDENGSF